MEVSVGTWKASGHMEVSVGTWRVSVACRGCM